MKTYDALRISSNHTRQKHDLQSRMPSKIVPENAFIVVYRDSRLIDE
jgi:hypothetical protein